MKKNLWSLALPSAVLVGLCVSSLSALAVTSGNTTQSSSKASVSVAGKSNVVFIGTVSAVNDTSLVVLVTKTSKNITILKNTSQTLPILKKTKVTKNGKKIDLKSIPQGTKVKIFGIYDKKTSTFVKVRWVKVL